MMARAPTGSTATGRRGRQEDERAVGRHDLLVGVVADEHAVGGQLVGLVEALGAILEGIGEGDDLAFDAEHLAGGQELGDGAGPAAAATDQGDLDLGGDGVGAEERGGGGQGQAADGQGGDELTARKRGAHDRPS